MSNTKSAQKAVLDAKIPASIRASVEALAKGLGVAAVELWSIFVRQYFVKGLTQVFGALVFIGLGIAVALQFGWLALLPFGCAIPFCLGAIMLLGNPKYYAIDDITRKINELR